MKFFRKSRIYRLKDIQNYLLLNPRTWEIMSIQPLEVNYLIEDKVSTREIYEIYNRFKKSKVQLHIHLSLTKVTDDCYIKFTETDSKKLFKEDVKELTDSGFFKSDFFWLEYIKLIKLNGKRVFI
jgi:hypothetical protein